MKKVLLLIIAIQLSACVSTRTFGYLNENYQNNYKVSKIIVSFEGVDIDEVLELEKTITQKLSTYNVKVIKYTTDDGTVTIRETGADALLILDVTKSSMSNYIPPAHHRAADGITMITTGGYNGTTLTMYTKSSLIDVKNGNTIWNAETGSTGNSKSTSPQQFDYSGLFELTFNDIIADMNDKGLFK